MNHNYPFSYLVHEQRNGLKKIKNINTNNIN